MVVFIAGVSLVKSLQVVEDSLPGGFLLWGIVNGRDLLAATELASV